MNGSPDAVVRQPPWYAWPLIGFVMLAGVRARLPWILDGHWLVATGALLIVLLYVLSRLWDLSPTVTMCGALILTIFSGNWGNLGLPGFPFLPDHALVAIVVLAIALRAPGTSNRPRLEVRPVHFLQAVLVLYALGSAAAVGTLNSQTGIFDLLDRLGIVPFAMLLLAPVIFPSARERNLLLATLVGLGAYLGLTAVFEVLGPHTLVFPHYIATFDATVPEARAGGPFTSYVTDGFANFACAVAAIIAFVEWRGRRVRYFAATVALLCTAGCFLTLERGVWIAAIAGAVVTGLATREVRRWLVPGLFVCGLVIGGMLLLSPSLAGKTASRASSQHSVWDRQNQTSAGLRMIEAKPLFGFGWDRFGTDSLNYFRQSPGYPMTGYPTAEKPAVLHDLYLSMAVELGLVGAVLWLAAFVWGVGSAIFSRGSPDLWLWKRGLLAITTFFMVVILVDPLPQNFTELLLWTWAGVAVGRVPVTRRRSRSPTTPVMGERHAPEGVPITI